MLILLIYSIFIVMESYKRILDLEEVTRKSLFLFGPRQTGKTYLLKQRFPEALYYDLLQSGVYLNLSIRPSILRQESLQYLDENHSPIIIDEIQKLPLLLDEVHSLIESHDAKFIITGSSSRKLKRGGANLLGGRARTRHLFPCVYPEISEFDLMRAIQFGKLPSIYQSDDPQEDLIAYCGNYLQEEIQAEGLVRKMDHFARFLEVAALNNAELVNFDSLSSDTGVAAKTVHSYFTILEDTLIGSMLKPFRKTVHRKAIATSKFYFFDVGVSNCLAGLWNIAPKTFAFGKAFEHLIFTELQAYLAYNKDRRPLCFWRDRYGHEVDFVIGDDIAIEVKSSEMVSGKQIKGLKMFSEEIQCKHKIAVSFDRRARIDQGIQILPWQDFLTKLWEGKFTAN